MRPSWEWTTFLSYYDAAHCSLHLLWHFFSYWCFSFMYLSVESNKPEMSVCKCHSKAAYSSVFFTRSVDFYYLAASRFSSLWTFYCLSQLYHKILSNTPMPWRAVCSNAFTEYSLCYGLYCTIESVTAAADSCLQSEALPAVDLQAVNKADRP